jgi:hypothetical protein
MLQPHNYLEHKEISAAFTKSDTGGEFIFSGPTKLPPAVFKYLPKVNRAYFRLRQQYQK